MDLKPDNIFIVSLSTEQKGCYFGFYCLLLVQRWSSENWRFGALLHDQLYNSYRGGYHLCCLGNYTGHSAATICWLVFFRSHHSTALHKFTSTLRRSQLACASRRKGSRLLVQGSRKQRSTCFGAASNYSESCTASDHVSSSGTCFKTRIWSESMASGLYLSTLELQIRIVLNIVLQKQSRNSDWNES